jgi:hypothetical protein
VKYIVNWAQDAVDDLVGVFASRPRDGQRIVVVLAARFVATAREIFGSFREAVASGAFALVIGA